MGDFNFEFAFISDQAITFFLFWLLNQKIKTFKKHETSSHKNLCDSDGNQNVYRNL